MVSVFAISSIEKLKRNKCWTAHRIEFSYSFISPLLQAGVLRLLSVFFQQEQRTKSEKFSKSFKSYTRRSKTFPTKLISSPLWVYNVIIKNLNTKYNTNAILLNCKYNTTGMQKLFDTNTSQKKNKYNTYRQILWKQNIFMLWFCNCLTLPMKRKTP